MGNVLQSQLSLQAQLDAANAKIAELSASKSSPVRAISVKISVNTGAICLYGLGRNPVTLYASGWKEVFGNPAIRAEIERLTQHAATKGTDWDYTSCPVDMLNHATPAIAEAKYTANKAKR